MFHLAHQYHDYSDHLCNLYGPSVLMDPTLTKADLLQQAMDEEGYADSEGADGITDTEGLLASRRVS